MSQDSVSIGTLLAAQIAAWPKERVGGLFRIPQGINVFSNGNSGPQNSTEARLWLEENARLLLGLEWQDGHSSFDRFLRFYAVEIGPEQRLYISDSSSYFPNGENGVRLLTEFSSDDSDTLFLRRLFRTNGVAFGLILLPAIPSDVEYTLEDFGEILGLLDWGFSSADLWEALKEKHPGVWDETYENPAKPSNRLAHRLHKQRLQTTTEARGTDEPVTGRHPDELSLQAAQRQASDALGQRYWSAPNEKRRIVARYLFEVLHF